MLFFMLAHHNKPSNRLANPQKLWIPLLVTTHKRSQRLIPTGSLYYSFCLLHCISDKVLTLKHNLYIFIVVNEHLINYV